MNTDLLRLFEIEAEIDERSASFLTKAIADNDLPGFDYLEFKKAVANRLILLIYKLIFVLI